MKIKLIFLFFTLLFTKTSSASIMPIDNSKSPLLTKIAPIKRLQKEMNDNAELKTTSEIKNNEKTLSYKTGEWYYFCNGMGVWIEDQTNKNEGYHWCP